MDIKKNIHHLRNEESTYTTYFELDPAQKKSRSCGILPIFAKDLNNPKNPASKDFWVIGYQRFWDVYSKLPAEKRQFYEIVLASLPCVLHIDAEVTYCFNPTFDEKRVEEGFFRYLYGLLVDLKLIPSVDEIELRTLVASNQKKYSKHFFVVLKNKKFKNNFHVGAFMRRLERLVIEKEGNNDNNPYFFHDDRTKQGKVIKFFADMCIYTQNRNFRIYGSSKNVGGYRPLVIPGQDPQELFHKPLDKKTLFDTLIQYTDPEDLPKTILTCTEYDGSEPSSRGGRTVRPGESLIPGQKRKSSGHTVRFDHSKSFKTEDYPEFVPEMASEIEKEWGEGVHVYPYQYNTEHQTITFHSMDTCCRMKREGLKDDKAEHKNHIYFVANIRRCSFVQRCFADNETCWIEEINALGERKKIRKSTRSYPFSTSLSSKIRQHVTGIAKSDAHALAKTLVSVYQFQIRLTENEFD